MSSIEERVKKIVIEQLGVKEEEVTTSASFVDDLGAEGTETFDEDDQVKQLAGHGAKGTLRRPDYRPGEGCCLRCRATAP